MLLLALIMHNHLVAFFTHIEEWVTQYSKPRQPSIWQKGNWPAFFFLKNGIKEINMDIKYRIFQQVSLLIFWSLVTVSLIDIGIIGQKVNQATQNETSILTVPDNEIQETEKHLPNNMHISNPEVGYEIFSKTIIQFTHQHHSPES